MKAFSISGFLTSSPLREEDENHDIWEELSMEYPGNNSPSGWDILDQAIICLRYF